MQTNSADFQTQKSLSVAPASAGGSEVSVEVTYEPCQLGEARATLQLSSVLGGEYSVPLVGLALPPQPQGPFLVRAGSTTSIPFKNVFPQPTAFRCAVEHPAFTVRAPASLRPKQTGALSVSFEGEAAVSSRLLVSCPGAAGACWLFYLRGLPSPRSGAAAGPAPAQ